MPLLDSLVKIADSQQAESMTLEPTRPPSMIRRGNLVALSMPPLGAAMLTAAVEELLDPRERGALLRDGAVDAARPVLGYAVRVEATPDGPLLRLRRGAPAPPARTPPAPAPLAAAPAPRAPSTMTPGPTAAPTAALADAPAPLDPASPLAALVALADARRASDVFLSGDRAVVLRIDGELHRAREVAPSPALLEAVVGLLDPGVADALRRSGSADLGFDWSDGDRLRRVRANLFRHADGLAATLRLVDERALSLDELGLPAELAELAATPSGLVLVAGLAGAGKSTTLAAMVDALDAGAARHVITLEDPIERRYQPRRCLVHQRQVGRDVESFAGGLRAALRESPDVLMVGEMRDAETIAAALTAADTGHLVLSTVHAAGAVSAIDRVIHAFPADRRASLRNQLAAVLRAVVAQRLVPTGAGRRPAVELLEVNHAVAAMIRDDRGHMLESHVRAAHI